MKIIYPHKEAVDEILKKISSNYKNHKKFCDLGYGRGERTVLFGKYDRYVTGIDYINYQSPNYKNFDFVKKDIFNNGFTAGCFDIILSFDVIEHIEKPEKLLNEILRLLKNNGICILSTPNKYRLFNAPLVFFGLKKYPYCLDSKNHKNDYPEYWHLKEYSVKELIGLSQKCNFKLQKTYKVFYGYSGGYGFETLFNAPFSHNLILVIKKCSTKIKN